MTVESAAPADNLPLLTFNYDDSPFTPSDYYAVKLTLANGEADADRDQITQYMAAVNHDGAGTLGSPIEQCGSSTPYPGQTSGFYNSIELNFVLEKATGNLVTDTAITSQATGTFLGAGSGSTCGIIRDTTSGDLRLVIQTFTSTDTSVPGTYSVYWDITLGATKATLNSRTGTANKGAAPANLGYFQPEYVTTPPSPPISLIPPTITLSLEVIDESGGLLAAINLGDKFKLRVTALIDVDAGTTYTTGLDVAGVVVKECTVGTDAAVTANTRIFITNFCAVQTDIFSTSDSGAGVGFTKNAGSTTLVGNLKTYFAESHLLEAGAITPIPDITTASHNLFFKCTVDINCYDDSTGSCSGAHCTSRKKRSDETEKYTARKRPSVESRTVVHEVKTKLQVLPDDTFETAPRKEMKTVMKPRPCSETLMFKATISTLGSAVVVMFFVMIYSYYDLKKAQRNAKMRRQGLDNRKMSGGSRTELMVDAQSCATDEKQSIKC